MAESQPCEKYLDVWRVGNEWLKVPEGAVCPRCGFTKAEHREAQDARADVGALLQAINARTSERDQSRAVVAMLEAAHVENVQQMAEQSAQIAALEAHTETAEAAWREELAAMQAERDTLAAQLVTVQQERDTAWGELGFTKTDLGNARHQVDTLAVQVRELTEALTKAGHAIHSEYCQSTKCHPECLAVEAALTRASRAPSLSSEEKKDDVTRIGQPDADPPQQHAATDEKG